MNSAKTSARKVDCLRLALCPNPKLACSGMEDRLLGCKTLLQLMACKIASRSLTSLSSNALACTFQGLQLLKKIPHGLPLLQNWKLSGRELHLESDIF